MVTLACPDFQSASTVRVYLTPRHSDDGIEEALCEDLSQWPLAIRHSNGITTFYFNWWQFGETIHTNRDEALAAARRHRAERITKTQQALERLKALPEIV